MRVDVYNFHINEHDFLVEMHSSRSKIKNLSRSSSGNGEVEGTTKNRAEEVARAVLELSGNKEGAQVSRVVIDQNWKYVLVYDASGKKVTRSWKSIQKMKGAAPCDLCDYH